jgi:hypothetical protein
LGSLGNIAVNLPDGGAYFTQGWAACRAASDAAMSNDRSKYEGNFFCMVVAP